MTDSTKDSYSIDKLDAANDLSESSDLHVDKKIKLENDEEVPIFQDSTNYFSEVSCSRSPPTVPYKLDEDTIVPLCPTELSAQEVLSEVVETVTAITDVPEPELFNPVLDHLEEPVQQQTTIPASVASILELRKSIMGLSDTRRNAFARSFTRLAQSAKQGYSPFMVPTPQYRNCCGAIDQNHDALTLQMLYAIVPPKQDISHSTSAVHARSFYPVAPAYPFALNSNPRFIPPGMTPQMLSHPSLKSRKWAEMNYNCAISRMYPGTCANSNQMYIPSAVPNSFIPQPQSFSSQQISQASAYFQNPVHV